MRAPSINQMPINPALPVLMTLPNDNRTDDQRRADQRRSQRGFASAWMVLGAAPAGLLIGYGIDRIAGTQPGWMIGLSLLFLALSLYQLIKDSR